MGWHGATRAVPWVIMEQLNFAATVGRTIATEMRRLRVEQGLSAQQLADRCAELGMSIPRTVISNIENGRRVNITVAEVLVLGGALGVPPGDLIFPAGTLPEVEILPGRITNTLDAIEWLAGETIIVPGQPDPVLRSHFLATRIYWARKVREMKRQVSDKESKIGQLYRLYSEAPSEAAKAAYAEVIREEERLLDEGRQLIATWIGHLSDEKLATPEIPFLPHPDYGIGSSRVIMEVVRDRPHEWEAEWSKLRNDQKESGA